ncbi:TetR/AcrR family transcriptional regulator [Staphylococcus schleiferi]|uniref:TetR/AcrR family transcriptional regulator n=1 Tax=Staphylococcus schleiferi TaxID=1295 RepID=UPI0024812E71|nr:TetR/AcrR family transcriptional regulator [Staphylococcus schleiferi]
MYEKIIDKRVYKTLMKIEKGMILLLKTKSYKEITVKDICRESNISRGTFYQHYQDKEDFLYQYQTSVMKKAKRKLKDAQFDQRLQFFEYVLNFWIHDGELLLLLLKDHSAYMIHQDMKKNLQQNIEVCLVPIVDTSSLTNKEKYFLIIFMSNAIFGILQDWVQRGGIESPKELTVIIDKIFKTVFV